MGGSANPPHGQLISPAQTQVCSNYRFQTRVRRLSESRAICACERDRPTVGRRHHVHKAGTLVYLAVVLDIYSRRVVGWLLGSLHTSLQLTALDRAVASRQPRPNFV